MLASCYATTAWNNDDQAQSASTEHASFEPLYHQYFFTWVNSKATDGVSFLISLRHSPDCKPVLPEKRKNQLLHRHARTLLKLYVEMQIDIYIYIYSNIYIYICNYTFVRVTMPHTPTSFRPPSLWPSL